MKQMTDTTRYRRPPAYHKAKVELDAVKARLSEANIALVLLEGKQRSHEWEQARFDSEPSDRPIISNAEALRRGNGSGFRIRYNEAVDPSVLEAAQRSVKRAARPVAKALERFEEVRDKDEPFDIVEAVKKKGTKFAARRPSFRLGGRTFYKGDPIPTSYLEEIGFAKAQKLATAGVIEQIIH